jgi:DNA-binding XRE family transcriptional regulator
MCNCQTAHVSSRVTRELTQARERLGLTQADLGTAVGRSRRAVVDWESKGSVPPDMRAAVAGALGLAREVLEPEPLVEHRGTGDGEGQFVLLVPAEVLDALTPTEAAEARAFLTAEFLAKVREFRSGH